MPEILEITVIHVRIGIRVPFDSGELLHRFLNLFHTCCAQTIHYTISAEKNGPTISDEMSNCANGKSG